MQHCDIVVNREYWLNGELILPSCCMFIHANNGWHQLYFDDEAYSFKFQALKDAPEISKTLGDDVVSYPHETLFKGVFTEFNLNTDDTDKASIEFSSGFCIKLNYNRETESVEYKVYT